MASSWETIKNMKCEIILVRYNNPEDEEKCIESVKKYTDLSKHKLTVFDNFEVKENLGVLWNKLISQATEEYICLLNTDTVVEENWLDKLLTSFTGGVGIAGPITNHCGGVQKNLTREKKIEEVSDLSGFCMVFPKKVWQEVYGFPNDFPFYGQDSVFVDKVRDKYKLVVNRDVFVWHKGQGSFKKAKDEGEYKNDETRYSDFAFREYKKRKRIFKELGLDKKRVAIIGSGWDNPFPLYKGTQQLVEELGHHWYLGNVAHPDVLRRELEEYKPDIMLCIQTNYSDDWYGVIHKLHKEQGVLSALYYNDLRCPNHPEWATPFKKTLELFYDYVFIGNNEFQDNWRKELRLENVYYMPQGCVQQAKPLPYNKDHSFPLVHIGGKNTKYHKYRIEVIDELKPQEFNSVHREQRANIQNKSYSIYPSSKFSLAVSPKSDMYTSDRLYTILGAGGCALSYNPGGLEKVFEHGKHLLWFNTIEEAKELLKTSDEKIAEIKDNAFWHAQAHHTYKMRLLNIFANMLTDDKSYWGLLDNLKTHES